MLIKANFILNCLHQISVTLYHMDFAYKFFTFEIQLISLEAQLTLNIIPEGYLEIGESDITFIFIRLIFC